MALRTSKEAIIGAFQRVLSMFRAGYGHEGKRDYYNVLGYPRTFAPGELVAKYERQDIAATIVDKPAEEMWSYPPELETDDTALETGWKEFTEARQDDLWITLMQADRQCWFGRYSTIWFGLPGNPEAPITNRRIKLENIAYMRAYTEQCSPVESWERDKMNPRYGLPNVYGMTHEEATDLKTLVHWTRVAHIVDRPLQGITVGVPRMQVVYNLLDDIFKIAGGSAETYWLVANRGMQVNVDKEMQLDEDDAKALSDELDEFQHQLRRYVRTRGVEINSLGSDMADPSGVFKVLISLLACATGIPQRILMGAEAGQLASEQDRSNWAEYIDRRRKSFAEPFVLRPLIAKLRLLGILPALEPGQIVPYQFKWPSAFHQSPLEAAQTMAQFARSVVNLSRQTEKGFAIATLEECREQLNLPAEIPEGQSLPKQFVPPLDPNVQAQIDAQPDPEDPETRADEDEGPRRPRAEPGT